MVKPKYENRLKEVREAKGLTQDQLAERIGTTQETISRLERGELDVMRWKWRTPLSRSLDCHPSEFLVGGPVRADQRDLLEAYDELEDRQRPAAVRLVRALRDAPAEPSP